MVRIPTSLKMFLYMSLKLINFSRKLRESVSVFGYLHEDVRKQNEGGGGGGESSIDMLIYVQVCI